MLPWSEEFGVNIAVCSVSSSSLTHYRNITLSRINCERLYFYKKSVFVRSLKFVIIIDYVSAYICIMYIRITAIQYL